MGTPLNPPRCLILGGGEITDYEAVAAQILATDMVICADSGFSHCAKLNVIADLLVGDFDSITGPVPDDIPRVTHAAEKDYTDTTLAIEHALSLGCRSLLLAGMLGGRFDHSIANLQSLAHLSTLGVEARITDGATDIFAMTSCSITLQPRENAYFSVFCLSQQALGVNIRGAKYPLTDHTLDFHTPRAVSNEFCGNNVEISVREGTLAVIVVRK